MEGGRGGPGLFAFASFQVFLRQSQLDRHSARV